MRRTRGVTPSGTSGSGVPAGGTTGQVLAKNSNTDGDAGWVTPSSVDHVTVPAANTGTGGPGVSTLASPADHWHPAVLGAGTYLLCELSTTSGKQSTAGRQSGTQAMQVSTAWSFPVVFTKSVAIKLGVNVTAAATTGGLVQMLVYADAATTDTRAGAKVADLGSVAVDSGTGVKLAPTSFTPVAGTKYWVVGYCTVAAPTISTVAAPSWTLPSVSGGLNLHITHTYNPWTGADPAPAPTTGLTTAPLWVAQTV